MRHTKNSRCHRYVDLSSRGTTGSSAGQQCVSAPICVQLHCASTADLTPPLQVLACLFAHNGDVRLAQFRISTQVGLDSVEALADQEAAGSLAIQSGQV